MIWSSFILDLHRRNCISILAMAYFELTFVDTYPMPSLCYMYIVTVL